MEASYFSHVIGPIHERLVARGSFDDPESVRRALHHCEEEDDRA
jgi:hypothetical protein